MKFLFCTKMTSYQTLKQLISEAITETYNWRKDAKYANCSNHIATGIAIELHKCGNLAVIDIDVQHDLPEDDKNLIIGKMITKLTLIDSDWPIVKCAHGGLHIYCLYNNFDPNTYNLTPNVNRWVKCIKKDGYDVDIICGHNKDKKQLIVCDGSKISDTAIHSDNIITEEPSDILSYEFINGSADSLVKHSIISTLNILGFTDDLLEMMCNSKEVEETTRDIERNNVEEVPLELFKLYYMGLKDLEIHATATNGAKDEIALVTLAASLYSFQDYGISPEQLQEAFTYIQDNCKLTKECMFKWDSKVADGKSLYDTGKNTGFGYLINCLKYHNPDYYTNTIISYWKKNYSNKQTFQNSPYTIEDFQNDISSIESIKLAISKLRLCVAIHTHGGYIIKQRTYTNNNKIVIEFQHIKQSELDNSIGRIQIRYKLTEEEKQKLRNDHKKVTDYGYIKINKLLICSIYFDKFDKYDGIELLSNNPKVLQLYQPPTKTEYDEKLVLEWIEFMKTLINNPEAFVELLDSNAFRFKYPTEFIEKFFINYGKGGNGKSYLTACLASIYPNCENTAVTQSQIENDTFNAWIVRNLLVWLEEAENSNYQSKAIQQKIKQLTTKKASARGMYNETRSARNWAIYGMNTNSKDLYGLARADEATISRLVILDFKDITRTFNEKAEFNKKCHSFIDNPNFAYSLYYYLANKHTITPNFSPVRYYGTDKQSIIDRLTMANRNSVQDWFAESYNDLVKTAKVKDTTYKLVYEKDANNSYSIYRENNNKRFCLQNIRDTMTDILKFEYKSMKIQGNVIKVYRITEAVYNELVKQLEQLTDDVVEEAEII